MTVTRDRTKLILNLFACRDSRFDYLSRLLSWHHQTSCSATKVETMRAFTSTDRQVQTVVLRLHGTKGGSYRSISSCTLPGTDLCFTTVVTGGFPPSEGFFSELNPPGGKLTCRGGFVDYSSTLLGERLPRGVEAFLVVHTTCRHERKEYGCTKRRAKVSHCMQPINHARTAGL